MHLLCKWSLVIMKCWPYTVQLRYWCIQDLQKPVNDFHVLYQNKQLYFPKLLGIPLCEADMGSLHHQLHSSAPQSRGFSQSQQDFHHWEECVKSQLLCSSSPTTSWERSCLHFLPPFGIFLLFQPVWSHSQSCGNAKYWRWFHGGCAICISHLAHIFQLWNVIDGNYEVNASVKVVNTPHLTVYIMVRIPHICYKQSPTI